MGVLNANAFNVRAYNQHVQVGSLPSNIELTMSTLSRLGLFNTLPYNSVPFNGGTPVATITGSVTINVTLNKAIKVTNISFSALGVFNTVPFNTLVYNGATAADNSSGKAIMTAVLGSVGSSVQANMSGMAYVSGGGATVIASQDGGYNSTSYLSVPYNDATYIDSSIPSDQLPVFTSGGILEAHMTGSGDIMPSPWLQAYNLNSSLDNQNATIMETADDSVYLPTT